MDYIFICKIKLLGMPFAVLTEEEAKAWEAENPESYYYDKVPVKSILTDYNPLNDADDPAWSGKGYYR